MTTTRPSIIAPIPFLDELNQNFVKMEHNLNEILAKMAGVSDFFLFPNPSINFLSYHEVQLNLKTYFS